MKNSSTARRVRTTNLAVVPAANETTPEDVTPTPTTALAIVQAPVETANTNADETPEASVVQRWATLARIGEEATRSTRTSGPKGRPFQVVYDEVQARAAEMVPDQVVHVADLRMTPDGNLVLPGALCFRIGEGWARKQLSAMLGLRWDRWFQSASGEERAEEINRRFQRTPGEKKIRAWVDRKGSADGVVRAFLAPAFNPIDDVRIFERMHTMMKGLLDEYRFTAVQFGDSTTHYTAVHVEAMDLDGHGDLLYPGFHLRNSEVGASALSLDDHWLRLVCTNGLMVRVNGRRLLYRTHRSIEDDQLAAALVIAIGRLPERWKVSFAWLQSAKQIDVPHPDSAVAAVLDSPEVPKALVEEAQRRVLLDGDHSRYGVVQAITLVAHDTNKDPNTRFAMERLAGDYLAATPSLTA